MLPNLDALPHLCPNCQTCWALAPGWYDCACFRSWENHNRPLTDSEMAKIAFTTEDPEVWVDWLKGIANGESPLPITCQEEADFAKQIASL